MVARHLPKLVEMAGLIIAALGKIVGKRRKCWLPAFSPFSHNVFYSYLQSPLNLDLSSEGLTLFHMTNFGCDQSDQIKSICRLIQCC